MSQVPPTVAEQVAFLDVLHCVECTRLRAEVQSVLEADGSTQEQEMHALQRWQEHEDERHQVASAYLRRGD